MSQRFIYEQQWTDADKASVADLGKLYLDQPHKISSMLTYLYGKQNVTMNPITQMTEGMGNMEEINGMEYEYPVFSTIERTIPLAEAVTATNAGKGHLTFKMKFPEKAFSRYYTIVSPNQYQIQIVNDPIQEGSYWVYECRYTNPSKDAYIPASELTAGTHFIQGWYGAAAWGSLGSNSNLAGTALVRGNISFLRKSFSWDGNLPHRDLAVEVPNGSGGTTKLAWAWQQWQIDKQWTNEVESHYLYAKSTRDADGNYPLKDPSGGDAPWIQGDMLLEQVGTKDTYGLNLSLSKLNQAIRDTYSNMKDAENKEILLMTGFGGAQSFDAAVKSGVVSGFTPTGVSITDGGKFIKGDERALRATGYFVQYDHIDGYTVKVKVSDVFNYGKMAMVAPRHPVTGLSLESHRMLFLDNSSYDGAANIKGMYDKARTFSRDVIKGVGALPAGFPTTGYASTDRDGHSIHYTKGCGVVLRRWTTSLDFKCVIS